MSALPRYRRLAYAAVTRRARGRCELCGAAQDPLDPHHTFGRTHLTGIPAATCETPELILGICRRCHDAIHDGAQALCDKARWIAVGLFMDRHELPAAGLPEDPLDAMRWLVTLLPTGGQS